ISDLHPFNRLHVHDVRPGVADRYTLFFPAISQNVIGTALELFLKFRDGRVLRLLDATAIHNPSLIPVELGDDGPAAGYLQPIDSQEIFQDGVAPLGDIFCSRLVWILPIFIELDVTLEFSSMPDSCSPS